jgi:hypothetical protein
VPVVLAGHFHSRSVKVDPSGTRIMIEGSTGGAGITSDTMHQVADGKPVPLEATLVYVARAGDRAGQVVAYDEISVGGFGLASVTIERTVIRPCAAPAVAPAPGPRPSRATPTPRGDDPRTPSPSSPSGRRRRTSGLAQDQPKRPRCSLGGLLAWGC